MRVRGLLLALGVGVASGALVQPPAPRDTPARDTPPAAVGTAAIRGRVMVALRQSSESSGQAERPLSRVEVRATSPELKINRAVLTDGSGRYEIAELPAGRYTISFWRMSYVRASYGQRRPLGPSAPVDVAMGQTLTLADVALQRSGVIAGRVVDEFGDPIASAQVTPMRNMFSNGRRRMQQAGPTAFSNDLGEYRIFGLAPGRYYISASFRTFNADAQDRVVYIPTYYPGTANAGDAQRLTVAPGDTLTSINMTLVPAAAARVSGTAFDSRGRPFDGAYVSMINRFVSGGFGAGGGQIAADGTFSIAGVTPGEYTLRASRGGTPDEIASAEITVSGGDVSGVQLVAAKPSTLRGRVVFDTDRAAPPRATAVRINAVHPDSFAMVSGLDSPKDDWTFEIKTDAGRTLIRAAVLGTGDWRLKRVLSADGADLTDEGLELPASASIDGLIVELTTRQTELSGTIVDAAGRSVRDCVVVLFAQDPRRWTTATRYFAVARPGHDHVFHARMPAGEYYAAAFELDDPSVFLNDPDIFQQLRDRATRLSIGEARKTTLTLPLSEPPVY